MGNTYFSTRLTRSVGWLPVCLLLASSATAQNTRYTLRGRVQDAAGEAVPGASVRILNTVLGTASGIDGSFELAAALNPGTYTLEVSSVGYRPQRQTVALGTDASFAVPVVSLTEDLVRLNDVVVTGTSVATSKRQLGNTIATVQAAELLTAVPTQIDQALQGKFSGVQITQNSGNPAGGISVRLRGPSTVAGSSEPLYIIDGVIVNNDSPQLLDLGGSAQNRLVDISPNDIERIEVIKGAAAAAIYGSRASNGVVQIFTKRGRDGVPQITVSSQFLVSQLRKKLDYNQYPFRFVNTNNADLTQEPVQRYDYQEDIFRTAIGTDNYVSLSGGNGGTKYFASGNYFRNQGIIDNSEFNRGGGRVRVQQTLGSKASLSAGAAYTLSQSRDVPNGGITEAYGALTGFIFSNNDINPAPDPITGRYPSTARAIARTNPLEAINRFDFRQRTSRFIGDVQLNLTPFAGFTVDYVLGYDASTQVGTGFIPVGSTAPTYTAGFARRADRTALLTNNDLTLSYRRDFLPWLASTTTAGGTLQSDQSFTTGIRSTQLAPLVQTTSSGIAVANEFRSERTIRGAFLQQTLGLGNRVFLTGAVRVDEGSIYGANNRRQTYYKAGASYVLSDEAFYKESFLGRALPQLKLRASYGQAGNLTAIDPYGRFTNFEPVQAGAVPGLLASTLQGNANLGPERQEEFEAGFDLSMLNDRLSFEFSYYDKQVNDLILRRDLNFSSGFSFQFANVGQLTNRGVELLVRAVPVQATAARWTVTGTFTTNRNKITNIPNGLVTFPDGFGLVAAVEGQPLGTYYGTYSARNPDGSLLLTPAGLPQRERGVQTTPANGTPQRGADGQPSGALLNGVVGNPNPRYIASLINEVALLDNRLTLRVQFDTQQNFDVFNFTKRVGTRDIFGGLAGYEAELRGEVAKGTSTAAYNTFDKWVEDGSFVKLREASVSFLIKPKAMGLRDLRLSVAGRNLLVFTDYTGYDPEVNAAGQSNAVRGFDFVEVPIPRSVSVGFNATF
ncbi:SusC/RagA family TonB-linked outer membrane protein [Hymenobacter puniceus]|uniref:SusC/RagA family TonB-linked outer membrane protein n=1 Tax=Hymenobacter sp. BT190 TaxID=2763505 RepID=UPI0016510D91|nr:SusC/RagA family TonB-linked outer membrane protein [Hymenobacter sp. BT190]MBC6696517.1 SusC/RagA family TonB-linked outer membrane protein [Hymenobacter sp. BT190]